MTSTSALTTGPAPVAPRTDDTGTGPGRVLAVGAAISAVVLAGTLVGLTLDHRLITGVPAWLKPAKFAVSITVYLLTLRWVLTQVSGHRRAVAVVSGFSVVVLLAELGWVGAQVVRGTTSHYDEATPFDAITYYTAGALITALFVLTLVTGVLVLRRTGLDAGVGAGIRWGLGVCLVGMLEAVLMVTNSRWNPSGGHTVGAPDGGPGMLLTGWSLDHGDLRIAHFVGLHAFQTLPLLAWLLIRATRLDPRTRARLVGVAGSAQAGLVGLLAWQALRGQPLLQPDRTTLLALAALAVPTTAGVLVVLARRHRPLPAPAVLAGLPTTAR
jgi:hypothetical protein